MPSCPRDHKLRGVLLREVLGDLASVDAKIPAKHVLHASKLAFLPRRFIHKDVAT